MDTYFYSAGFQGTIAQNRTEQSLSYLNQYLCNDWAHGLCAHIYYQTLHSIYHPAIACQWNAASYNNKKSNKIYNYRTCIQVAYTCTEDKIIRIIWRNIPYSTKHSRAKTLWLGHHVSIHRKTFALAAKQPLQVPKHFNVRGKTFAFQAKSAKVLALEWFILYRNNNTCIHMTLADIVHTCMQTRTCVLGSV